MRREDAPGALLAWDVESTGVDIENDRILTAYAMVQDIRGNILNERHWTIDPGIPVPRGASDVHHMTTEWIRENGRKDCGTAISEILTFLYKHPHPIVGYNNSYDLGILDREMRRHHGQGIDSYLEGRQFFDPIIWDRANDKYRRGARKLMDVAQHYGIKIDESRLHEAEYDVIVTAKLAWILLQKSDLNLDELQSAQVEWKRTWAEHLTEYFASQNKLEEDGSPIVVDGSFPWKKKEGHID